MPSLFVLLVLFVGVGVLAIVLIKIITSFARPRSNWRPPQPPAQNLMTSMADDGFWITSDQLDPATMLQYYYWVNGVRQMGEVPFQPGPDGRQFIYTGEKPDSVSVALAAAALRANLPEDSSPPIISTPSPRPRRSSSSDSHFPRAY